MASSKYRCQDGLPDGTVSGWEDNGSRAEAEGDFGEGSKGGSACRVR